MALTDNFIAFLYHFCAFSNLVLFAFGLDTGRKHVKHNHQSQSGKTINKNVAGPSPSCRQRFIIQYSLGDRSFPATKNHSHNETSSTPAFTSLFIAILHHCLPILECSKIYKYSPKSAHPAIKQTPSSRIPIPNS